MLVKGTNYRTLDGLYADMREIIAASELPCEWVQLGRSARDRPIAAVCLGDGDFTKPELLFMSGVHAMEYMGPAMNMALLQHAAAQPGDSQIGRAVERCNVWFLPVLNPDGYERITRMLTSGLGLAYSRTNANGVDLNRNFPAGFFENKTSFFAGSPIKASPYHRGKEPCSEPESRVFRDFVLNRNFKISADFHCFGNLIGYPYGFSEKEPRDKEVLRRIAREYMNRQKLRKYRIVPMHKLYRVSGDIGDWLYDECRVLAFTIEIGGLGFDLTSRHTAVNPFFWANPEDPRRNIDNNLEPCLYLIDALLELFGGE